MRKTFLAAIRQRQRERESGVLIGVRNICHYTQIGTHTFYAWVQGHDFPATHAPGGRWMTSKSLIDQWIIGRWKAQRAEKTAGQGALARPVEPLSETVQVGAE